MRVSEIRVWTAIAVFALSIVVAKQAITVAELGWNFAWANQDDAKSRLSHLATASTVGYLTQKKLLSLAPEEAAYDHAAELANYLARAPMDSDAWLQYARAQFAAGGPTAKMAASLALSSLTGPNESWIAAQRIAFELPVWAILPPDTRRSLVSDMTGPGIDALDETQRFALNVAMRTAALKSREEIRATLLLAGKKGEAIAKALGLAQAVTPRSTANAQQNDVDFLREAAPGGEGGVPKVSVPSGALSPSPLAPPATMQPAIR